MWIHSWLISDLLVVPLHNVNLASVFYSPKYFNFMLLQGSVICEILVHLKIWRVPKSDNIMYQKDLFRDWTSSHLHDYTWYMNCPKDNTPPFEKEFWKKIDVSYLKRLASSEMEIRANGKKKVQDGAKKKAREKLQTPILKEKTQGSWNIKKIGKDTFSHLSH